MGFLHEDAANGAINRVESAFADREALAYVAFGTSPA